MHGSQLETEYLVNIYKLHGDDIGKKKLFKLKKDFFTFVSGSMAGDINSLKTADQVTIRFYTLTKKPKVKNDGPPSNFTDTNTIVTTSTNGQQSVGFGMLSAFVSKREIFPRTTDSFVNKYTNVGSS